MSWGNAWAWLGLVALALPVLVHMLSRRRAVVRRFPTLRFLVATRPIAVRRSRVTDLPLLVVRLLVLGLAVAALAQPYVLSADRRAGFERLVARAIVVDTSASMRRPAAAGGTLLDVARAGAAQAQAGASASVVLETATPAAALAGAAEWLETRPGRREIVVFSDFQLGVLDTVELARVPLATGLDLRRVDAAGATVGAASAVTGERVVSHGGAATVVRSWSLDGGTRAEWWRVEATPGAGGQPAGNGLALLAGDGAGEAEAALAAALAVGAPAPDPGRPIALVFPGHGEREALIGAARPVDAPWMGDVAVALAADPVLALAVARDGAPASAGFVAGVDEGGNRLLVAVDVEPGSTGAAALIAAVTRAAATEVPPGEAEPAAHEDAELAEWRRAAAAPAAAGTAGESDGRWVWLAVLGLLGLEAVVRRRPRGAGRSRADGRRVEAAAAPDTGAAR